MAPSHSGLHTGYLAHARGWSHFAPPCTFACIDCSCCVHLELSIPRHLYYVNHNSKDCPEIFQILEITQICTIIHRRTQGNTSHLYGGKYRPKLESSKAWH